VGSGKLRGIVFVVLCALAREVIIGRGFDDMKEDE
jgi:hypothetical protein